MTVLPRVYSVGFRAGQTVHHFWNAFLAYVAGSEGHDENNFALSNRIWFRIQEEAPELWTMITSLPVWYKTWWMDLLRNDPVHLFVETTLLLSVLYMFVTRTKDYSESKKDKLTKQEEDDLIHEWRDKTRAPLASPISDNSLAVAKDVPEFVVHKVVGTKMQVTMDKDPQKYDVVNFGTFDFLGFSSEFTAQNPDIIPDTTTTSSSSKADTSGNADAVKSTENTIDAADDNKTGEVDSGEGASKNTKKKKRKKKKTAAAAAVDASADTTVNASSSSTTEEAQLDTSNMNPMKKASADALERYGCGACGPRGFYGTIDPHLKLEEEFAKFMGTDGAILYSDGASTVSSTIAAFCKRGDLLVVDEGVREPIVAGVKLSRAYVKWFKHNDMVCFVLLVCCVVLFLLSSFGILLH